MNRWLWMASVAVMMSGSTGCLRHQTRMQHSPCADCQPGTACPPGHGCHAGFGSRLKSVFGCNCGRTGCVTGPIGWQQGGLNYSSHLCPVPGTQGHGGVCNAGAGAGYGGHGAGAGYGAGPGMCGPGGAHGAGGPGGAYGAGGPGGLAGLHGQGPQINPGAPSAQVAYPYYSHRGPRDFLLDNPPSIGR